MKTHHTPGPWIYKIRPDGSAYMLRGDPKTGPHHQSDVYGSVDDIRLMASAPDLLAAVEGLKQIIELAAAGKDDMQFVYLESRRGTFIKVTDALIAAEQAIAKATDA